MGVLLIEYRRVNLVSCTLTILSTVEMALVMVHVRGVVCWSWRTGGTANDELTLWYSLQNGDRERKRAGTRAKWSRQQIYWRMTAGFRIVVNARRRLGLRDAEPASRAMVCWRISSHWRLQLSTTLWNAKMRTGLWDRWDLSTSV